MTVREAMARIDSREFEQWRVFDRYCPFEDYRQDWRNALLCVLLSKDTKVPDFLYPSIKEQWDKIQATKHDKGQTIDSQKVIAGLMTGAIQSNL